MLRGSCLCQGVLFEIDGTVIDLLYCHCSMCRKAHGSAFRARGKVRASEFRWRQGEELVRYYASSPGQHRSFCSVCGSNLITRFDDKPGVLGLALGVLDDDPVNRPICHVHVGSKAPWHEITDELPRFQGPPDGPVQHARPPANEARMPTAADQPWAHFHKAALGRPARELLIRTLNFFSVEGRSPGVAIDLGCGSGPDSIELLRRGWTVHAVDAEASGLALLRDATPAQAQGRLFTHETRLEVFEFPRCDLVWSSFALPFCAADEFPALLGRAKSALEPGGRIAGDLFGDRHAWSAEPGVLTLSETQARSGLAPLTIEAFDIEDGHRVSGGEITRWHAFGFAARQAKPA